MCNMSKHVPALFFGYSLARVLPLRWLKTDFQTRPTLRHISIYLTNLPTRRISTYDADFNSYIQANVTFPSFLSAIIFKIGLQMLAFEALQFNMPSS